ncbi:MAG: hypothetical protein ABSA86_07315 [Oryzomonas sp.]
MAFGMLLERISVALGSGELRMVPDSFNFKPLGTIADLPRPWEEMFPGVTRDDDKDTRNIFSSLNRPVLTPQVRTSRSPLPVPARIAASPKSISPALFASIKGVWEFYKGRGIAAPALLEHAFDDKGLMAFVEPLNALIVNYWPLAESLDMVLNDYATHELPALQIMLPCFTYDDEGAEVVEAFLSGPNAVQSLLTGYENAVELPPKDWALIAELGLDRLIEAYAEYPGEKSVDLLNLYQWYEVYFGPVKERFPKQMAVDYMVISGNSGEDNSIIIAGADDIEFSIAYTIAYDTMLGDIPFPYDFAFNENGERETFIHEICNCWRLQNGKRPVKWQPRKPKTLANVFKKDGFRGDANGSPDVQYGKCGRAVGVAPTA